MLFFLYEITCLVNGKKYIGWTGPTLSPENRWKTHLMIARTKQGSAIHAAIRKYGVDSFRFRPVKSFLSRALVLRAEVVAVRKTLAPLGYNIAPGGYGGTTSEMARKVQASRSPQARIAWAKKAHETRRARGNPIGGTARSTEENRRAALKGHAVRRARGNKGGMAVPSKRRRKRIGRKISVALKIVYAGQRAQLSLLEGLI